MRGNVSKWKSQKGHGNMASVCPFVASHGNIHHLTVTVTWDQVDYLHSNRSRTFFGSTPDWIYLSEARTHQLSSKERVLINVLKRELELKHGRRAGQLSRCGQGGDSKAAACGRLPGGERCLSKSLRQLQSLPPTPSSAVKRGLETVSP